MMKEKLCKCLEENGVSWGTDGILIDLDSIHFISMIVSIEEEFEVELPDEILLNSNKINIDYLCTIIEELCNN